MGNNTFLRFAAITAFISALTTIGVHFIDFPVEGFEERLLLARDTLYIQHKWMIIVHCLMVIISMCGVATLLWHLNKGLAALGMLFFSVFGIAEITRMFSVLAYLNPMREKYLAATNDTVRQILQLQIESFSQGTLILFLVFILGFALGNLFYGLALIRERAEDKWMGIVFLLLALTTSLSFANSFWEIQSIGRIVEESGKFFTPVVRLIIGIWLWRKATASTPIVF